jgi:hypothetical protein
MLARAIVVGLGLAVMLPALLYHGFISVYPQPKPDPTPMTYNLTTASSPEERKAYADEQQRRHQAFQAALAGFSKYLLVTATAFGVFAILLGSTIAVPAISAGVMAGGTIAVGIGYWSYSSGLPEWWRFASLLAGGLCLAWVGYRQWRLDRACRLASIVASPCRLCQKTRNHERRISHG